MSLLRPKDFGLNRSGPELQNTRSCKGKSAANVLNKGLSFHTLAVDHRKLSNVFHWYCLRTLAVLGSVVDHLDPGISCFK